MNHSPSEEDFQEPREYKRSDINKRLRRSLEENDDETEDEDEVSWR